MWWVQAQKRQKEFSPHDWVPPLSSFGCFTLLRRSFWKRETPWSRWSPALDLLIYFLFRTKKSDSWRKKAIEDRLDDQNVFDYQDLWCISDFFALKSFKYVIEGSLFKIWVVINTHAHHAHPTSSSDWVWRVPRCCRAAQSSNGQDSFVTSLSKLGANDLRQSQLREIGQLEQQLGGAFWVGKGPANVLGKKTSKRVSFYVKVWWFWIANFEEYVFFLSQEPLGFRSFSFWPPPFTGSPRISPRSTGPARTWELLWGSNGTRALASQQRGIPGKAHGDQFPLWRLVVFDVFLVAFALVMFSNSFWSLGLLYKAIEM